MAPRKRKADDGAFGAGKKIVKAAHDSNSTMRVTRNMAVTASRNAVFDTSELLEAIIVRLPYKKILGIQRVSTQFRDAITTSVQIQQKLFFRARAPREDWDICSTAAQKPAPRNVDNKLILMPHSKSNTTRLQGPITPTIRSHLTQTQSGKPYNARLNEKVRNHGSPHGLNLTATHVHQTGGSWRQMLLTDPPCKELRLQRLKLTLGDRVLSGRFITDNEELKLENNAGLTAGEVIDSIWDQRLELSVAVFPGFSMRTSSVRELCRETGLETEMQAAPHALKVRVSVDIGDMLPLRSGEWRKARRRAMKVAASQCGA